MAAGGAMELSEFLDFHEPALEADPAKHNLLLGLFARARSDGPDGLLTWTLGAPGQCAIKTKGRRSIILGDLTEEQCRALAAATRDLDYPGVLGSGETAKWFVEDAAALGLSFRRGAPQSIQALSAAPIAPDAPGYARQVAPADADILSEWMLAFICEAVPEDPIPTPDEFLRMAGSGRYYFWIADDRPVSMAAIGRRVKNAASIGPVYTPPEERGRGFAGAVTAAAAKAIFAEGRAIACLYTDLRNPASNRCYEKLGFRHVCDSWQFFRG